MTTLTTPRLILRQWRESDLEPFAAMNADPRVREFFPSMLTREESDLQAKHFADAIEKIGWSFWAVEVKSTGKFIGFIGLTNVQFTASFTPAVEIGWRLAYDSWGHGYATEGAQAALKFGFEVLNLPEIVSFAVVGNVRSQRVMEKLGMLREPESDFDHPEKPEGPLRRHVFYRLKKSDWMARIDDENLF